MSISLKNKKIVFQIITFQTVPCISNNIVPYNDSLTDNTNNVCKHTYLRSEILATNIYPIISEGNKRRLEDLFSFENRICYFRFLFSYIRIRV